MDYKFRSVLRWVMPSLAASDNTLIFCVVSVVMCVVIIVLTVLLLMMDPKDDGLEKTRWAGLYEWNRWWLWLFSVIFTTAAYCVFFFMFVIDNHQAAANSMHTVVSSFSVLFCWSVAMWRYVLRRSELHGVDTRFARERWSVWFFLELILAFPFSLASKIEREYVVINVCITLACSVMMLIFFCIGAAESGYSDAEVAVLCALVYMVLHLLLVDLWIWASSWYHMKKDVNGPPMVNEKRTGTGSIWSDVPLLERVPLLSARTPALRVEHAFPA